MHDSRSGVFTVGSLRRSLLDAEQPSNSMDPAVIWRAVHLLLLILSIGALCLSSAIFDFIVMNRMYYTLPDKRVLIDEGLSWIFVSTAALIIVVAIASLIIAEFSHNLQNLARHFECLLGFMHGFALLSSTSLAGFCCFKALQTAFDILPFAYNATPLQFERASHWYYVRLVAVSSIFGCCSLLAVLELLFVHCGVRLHNRPFARLIPANAAPSSLYIPQERKLVYLQ